MGSNGGCGGREAEEEGKEKREERGGNVKKRMKKMNGRKILNKNVDIFVAMMNVLFNYVFGKKRIYNFLGCFSCTNIFTY